MFDIINKTLFQRNALMGSPQLQPGLRVSIRHVMRDSETHLTGNTVELADIINQLKRAGMRCCVE